MTTKMKCHYEILGVPRDATADDLKKSYRKLALQWHPDKNPDRVEEVTKHFLLIQQAYDVLSDPQERAWYDKHREAILRGGHGRGDQYTDDSLDVFQYFNTSCYSGYGADEKSFYTTYRKVFQQLAEEDYVFMDNREDFEMPQFGDSTSSYEEVVGPFYAYWESFYTAKSYVWVEKYDTREAPDRRVRRLMEAENKKLRDSARKERSEEVRALVAFVRKRDRRVQAYRKKLEERAAEICRKNAERRERQVKERLKLLENYAEADWSSMSGLEEEMQRLEANLSEQFGDKQSLSGSDEQEFEEEEAFDDLFCVACNKSFKSDRAFANHERSKKHKENVLLLRSEMEEEEQETTADDEMRQGSEDVAEETTEEVPTENKQKLSKKQKKRRKERAQQATEDCDGSEVKDQGETIHSSKPPTIEASDLSQDQVTAASELVKQHGMSALEEITADQNKCATEQESTVDIASPTAEENSSVNLGKKRGKKSNKSSDSGTEVGHTPQICNVCLKEFPTRNKLFQHVKAEGHALQVPPKTSATSVDKASGKKKGRRKGKHI